MPSMVLANGEAGGSRRGGRSGRDRGGGTRCGGRLWALAAWLGVCPWAPPLPEVGTPIFFFPSSGFLRFVNGEFVASVIFNFVLQRLLE